MAGGKGGGEEGTSVNLPIQAPAATIDSKLQPERRSLPACLHVRSYIAVYVLTCHMYYTALISGTKQCPQNVALHLCSWE